MYTVYRAFDKNGKSYIGCTSRKISARFQGHRCEAKKGRTAMKFHAALRKGIRFEIEVLLTTDDKEQAYSAEKAFIKQYDAIKTGYNMIRGGVGFDSEAKEIREKVSNTLKNVYHKKPETREKHSRERGGTEVFVFKKNGDLVGKYSTQIEACEVLKLPKSKVCLALQGKRKTVNGFVLRNSFNPPKKLDVIGDRNLPIKVYKNEVFFGEWDSIRKFCKDNHMSAVTVRKIIGGEKPSDLRFEKVRM